MNHRNRVRATREERKVIFRDVLIFQLKLALDGLKDIVLSPLAILAAAADVIFPTDRVGKRFYHVLRMGEQFDRYLSLYKAAEHADAGEGGLFGASRAGSDSMLGKLESMVLGHEESNDPWLNDYATGVEPDAGTAPTQAYASREAQASPGSDSGTTDSPSPDRAP